MTISPRPTSPATSLMPFLQKECMRMELLEGQNFKPPGVCRLGEERLLLRIGFTGSLPVQDAFGRTQIQKERQSYVLKWTSPDELAGNRLYETILQALGDASFFSVPSSIASGEHGLDMQDAWTALHTEKHPLFAKLREILTSIHQKATKKTPDTASYVMRSEKVQGVPLSKFLVDDYPKIAQKDKDSFWRRIAQLATLDLFLGNTDRLAQVRHDPEYNAEKPIDFANCSNLKNLMIQKQENEIAFFAIDNQLNPSFFSPELAPKYQEFLYNLVNSPTFAKDFARILQASLLDEIQELEGARLCAQELREENGALCNALQLGVEQMEISFQKDILPSWNSSANKQHLNTLVPDFSTIISHRYQSVQTAIEKRNLQQTPQKSRLPAALHADDLDIAKRIQRESSTPTSPGFLRIATPLREENEERRTLYDLLRRAQADPSNEELLKTLQAQLNTVLTSEQPQQVLVTPLTEPDTPYLNQSFCHRDSPLTPKNS